MVEKRIIAFIMLAIFVWAIITTSFMTYYYLEQITYQEQLNEKQQLLNELSENYDTSTAKRNLLSGEYGMLLGDYQFFVFMNWFANENSSLCMSRYEKLLSDLSGNYTSILSEYPELNKTYIGLLNEFLEFSGRGQVTKEDFGSLLDSFYKLFTALTMKEQGCSMAKASEIQVSLCINYTKITGEPTIEWHNTSISIGTTLFDLTKEAANITYDYYATMEPGHIIITSINNHTAWWIWYYWDETLTDWRWGPVGCDAWILKNNGIYKWDAI